MFTFIYWYLVIHVFRPLWRFLWPVIKLLRPVLFLIVLILDLCFWCLVFMSYLVLYSVVLFFAALLIFYCFGRESEIIAVHNSVLQSAQCVVTSFFGTYPRMLFTHPRMFWNDYTLFYKNPYPAPLISKPVYNPAESFRVGDSTLNADEILMITTPHIYDPITGEFSYTNPRTGVHTYHPPRAPHWYWGYDEPKTLSEAFRRAFKFRWEK